MNSKEYVKTVLSHIKDKSYLAVIEQELNGHIEDRCGYYKDCGYDEETALNMAMEHIGNPDDVGEQMNRLHDDKRLTTISVVFKCLEIIAWGVFAFAADSILSVSYSLSFTGYAVRANSTIALLFFLLLFSNCAEFCVAVKTRKSQLMHSIAYLGFFISLMTIVNMPDSLRTESIEFECLKGLTVREMIYDADASTQLMLLFMLIVFGIMLLTSAVSMCIYSEFKAFEKGKAKTEIIYKGEKYKYFLIGACVPSLAYIVASFGAVINIFGK